MNPKNITYAHIVLLFILFLTNPSEKMFNDEITKLNSELKDKLKFIYAELMVTNTGLFKSDPEYSEKVLDSLYNKSEIIESRIDSLYLSRGESLIVKNYLFFSVGKYNKDKVRKAHASRNETKENDKLNIVGVFGNFYRFGSNE